jgi:hypothetical protein
LTSYWYHVTLSSLVLQIRTRLRHIDPKPVDISLSLQLHRVRDHSTYIPLHRELGNSGHLHQKFLPEVSLRHTVDRCSAINGHKIIVASD